MGFPELLLGLTQRTLSAHLSTLMVAPTAYKVNLKKKSRTEAGVIAQR